MKDVVIVDSVRTGLAKAFRGSFNLTRSDDMLAHCIDSLLDRNPNLGADEVEDVVVGAASHTGEQDGNLARLAVILSLNDLAGAVARDEFGEWEYDVGPGGEGAREMTFRLGLNVVMYALCLDYKEDQVHIPFILQRRP